MAREIWVCEQGGVTVWKDDIRAYKRKLAKAAGCDGDAFDSILTPLSSSSVVRRAPIAASTAPRSRHRYSRRILFVIRFAEARAVTTPPSTAAPRPRRRCCRHHPLDSPRRRRGAPPPVTPGVKSQRPPRTCAAEIVTFVVLRDGGDNGGRAPARCRPTRTLPRAAPPRVPSPER